jgi:hypothetical protein
VRACEAFRHARSCAPNGAARRKQSLDGGTATSAASRLGACAAEIGARAGASRGARQGAGEACGRPPQRAGNAGWHPESPRPFGLGRQGGAGVVAPLARASSPGCAPRLAITPFAGPTRAPISAAQAPRSAPFGTPARTRRSTSQALRPGPAGRSEAVCRSCSSGPGALARRRPRAPDARRQGFWRARTIARHARPDPLRHHAQMACRPP